MSSPGELTLDWWGPGTVPAPASIVWCAFPSHLDLGRPGPKSRPALVLKARHADDPPTNHFLVQVAYGTSNLKSDTRPFDFAIINYSTLSLCRLPQATRFDLDLVLWLPWARPFFEPRRSRTDQFTTPVMSTLPGELQKELAWLMRDREQLGMNKHLKAGC